MSRWGFATTPPRYAVDTKLHHSEISTPDRKTVAESRANRKELKTPLCEQLIQKIVTQGNVSIGQFMKECLTHPEFGYYSTKKKVIGADKADFITSAELPFFGEVLAAWVIDTWMKMGTPRSINLIELGPGRGTLMKNLLTQVRNVQPQLLHFLNVHLVEVGAARQEEQKKALAEFQTASGKIRWWMTIDSVPHPEEPTILIANEYFDALPVSHFRKTERGWVEIVLDVDDDPMSEAHFKPTLAPLGTMTAYLIPDEVRKSGEIGDQIEVNALGMNEMEKIMLRLSNCKKSAACIIDYGKDEHMQNTLRGIRGHKFVDPMLSPGDVDLSAWVSFKQLKWVLERVDLFRKKFKWFGPITQSDFLANNGIDVLLTRCLKDKETKDAMRFLQAYRRLMDDEEMGRSYKVLVVQSRNFPSVAPFFAGDECPLPELPEPSREARDSRGQPVDGSRSMQSMFSPNEPAGNRK